MSPGRRSSNPWNGEPKPSLEGPIDIKEFETPQWALFAFRDDQSEIDFIHCRLLFSHDTLARMIHASPTIQHKVIIDIDLSNWRKKHPET